MDYSSLPPLELLRKCAQANHREAWEEFLRRFHRSITLATLRTAQRWREQSPAVIEDLVQEVYLKLCRDLPRLLATFQAYREESLECYLKVLAASVVMDHFKAGYAAKRGSGIVPESVDDFDAPVADSASGSAGNIEQLVLIAQIDAIVEASSFTEQERTIYRLLHRQGLSTQAVANLPGIGLSAKGVESLDRRISQFIRNKLRGGKGFRPWISS